MLVKAFSSFNERKKKAYDESIIKIKEKFFSLYNGYEKKKINDYNALKEKIFEDSAAYLNMCYYPVELDENQREDLLNQFNNLQQDINTLISKR